MTCHARVIAQLREAGVRLTPQRAMVLEALFHHPGHATVEEVHRRVQAQSPYVDLSTVYRTLALLKRQGVVGELHVEGQPARYEAVRAEMDHHHAVCSRCGRILEVAPTALDALREELLTAHGFHAHLVHCCIPGLCAECAAAT
ncbi:MAG: transcriptional repressor [Caldilineales bacterium]|nr:transcriptional repressor [Caldilineales bacterium]MDW8316571.1 Fur family transcriptional regulator [Anaerolineae bacterium]